MAADLLFTVKAILSTDARDSEQRLCHALDARLSEGFLEVMSDVS